MPSVTFKPDQDIPRLDGQVIIVTGGNTGLGFATIQALGKHHPAQIYLAARSKEKAQEAIRQLRDSNPQIAPITFLKLDLASLASARAAANTFVASESRLDILVNNAGIMMTAPGLTEDGYEMQFGTNVMGPALFTQLLLPTLRSTFKLNPQTRVVNLSSGTERIAPLAVYDKLDELKTTMAGRHTTARYALSKLADIHWTSALAERSGDVRFISAHPGAAATSLASNSSGMFLRPFLKMAMLVLPSADKGALCQLWAATSPEARSGEFYGPVGVRGQGSAASRDRELQEKLWAWMEKELSGNSQDPALCL
jgi:NAD(P)-dependent dehydrogenase (short-subunit alcohol dehydrogenase family)